MQSQRRVRNMWPRMAGIKISFQYHKFSFIFIQLPVLRGWSDFQRKLFLEDFPPGKGMKTGGTKRMGKTEGIDRLPTPPRRGKRHSPPPREQSREVLENHGGVHLQGGLHRGMRLRGGHFKGGLHRELHSPAPTRGNNRPPKSSFTAL